MIGSFLPLLVVKCVIGRNLFFLGRIAVECVMIQARFREGTLVLAQRRDVVGAGALRCSLLSLDPVDCSYYLRQLWQTRSGLTLFADC